MLITAFIVLPLTYSSTASGNTIKAVIIYKFRNWEHTLMDARGNQIKVVLRQMKMKEVTI